MLRSNLATAAFMMWAVIVLLFLCPVNANQAVFTLDDLLAKAKYRHSMIKTIEYEFTSKLSTRGLDNKTKAWIKSRGIVGLEQIAVGQDGDKRYFNHKFYNDPNAIKGLQLCV